jgi:hypothetical protein
MPAVPIDAVSFVFAYPLKCLAGQLERLLYAVDDHSEEAGWFAFLLLGGFCYLDAHNNVLRCNALSLSETPAFLHLLGPYATADERVTAVLREQGRVEAVTLHALRTAGFGEFAWVNPNETPGGAELGDTFLTSWEFGAFHFGNVWYKISFGEEGAKEEPGRLGVALSEMYHTMAKAEEKKRETLEV